MTGSLRDDFALFEKHISGVGLQKNLIAVLIYREYDDFVRRFLKGLIHDASADISARFEPRNHLPNSPASCSYIANNKPHSFLKCSLCRFDDDQFHPKVTHHNTNTPILSAR